MINRKEVNLFICTTRWIFYHWGDSTPRGTLFMSWLKTNCLFLKEWPISTNTKAIWSYWTTYLSMWIWSLVLKRRRFSKILDCSRENRAFWSESISSKSTWKQMSYIYSTPISRSTRISFSHPNHKSCATRKALFSSGIVRHSMWGPSPGGGTPLCFSMWANSPFPRSPTRPKKKEFSISNPNTASTASIK